MYFQSNNKDFKLLHGDAMGLLSHVDYKIDMIFADPPYFLSKGISTCINGTWKSFEKGKWDRIASQDDINAFNKKWLSE